MKYYFFCVDDKPFCIWDGGSQNINAEYIKHIDPKFYEFVAEQNYNIICDPESERENRQYAAISLRNHYTQALETLFALVFATLQAPACIPGWMIKYRNSDIYNLVEKVNNSIFIKNRFSKVEKISWSAIIGLIFQYFDEGKSDARTKEIKKFTKLISAFASDFLDKNLHDEYNSIKHGFRTKAGGNTLSLKAVYENGRNKKDSKWNNFLQSEYGSSLYIDEKLLGSNNHFRLKYHSNNWNPENIYYGIGFISLLIQNLIAFLKTYNQMDLDGVQYKSVTPDEVFNSPWKNLVGTGNITIDFGFDYANVKKFSKEEILATYKQEI